MKKSRLLCAVCACVVAFYLPSSSYAAIVLNSGPQAGGDVLPFVEDPGGTTVLDVQFFSNVPIIIDFLNFAPADNLNINTIANGTGTAWSGIDFTFVNSTVLSPLGITPFTGAINGVFFDGGPIFLPGVTTSVSLTFDPSESIGLINGIGDIQTNPGLQYSLIITPTAVPIPAAVWLFGSGLLGLVGMARRKKA